jgi:signal transduction histidine kinase
MDGYTVCDRLKACEATREIPVIFLSALSDTPAKVKAFGAGGVDYVTKPFQFDEVFARVETHLRLRRLMAQLEESLAKLREMERLRDNLVHMMVHDMRSPLMGIGGNLDLVLSDAEGRIPDEDVKLLERSHSATKQLAEMVSAMLDVSRIEAGKMTVSKRPCDLEQLTREALGSLGSLVGRHAIEVRPESGPVRALVDPELTGRVLANLLVNAVKFTPPGGRITVELATGPGVVRVAVVDTGAGIPASYHAKVFEKFGQVQAQKQGVKYSTGLGLTFCKLAVEAQGGRIGLESEEGHGSRFWFELPSGNP